MKAIFLVSLIFVLLLACEANILEVLATDGIAVLPRVGNVKIILDFNDGAVSVLNQNASAVGVYITKFDESSIVVFSDGYIGGGKSETQTGVYFEYGWRLRVKVVVYKSLSASVSAFIASLGRNFLDNIQDFWIEKTYEEIVIIKKV